MTCMAVYAGLGTHDVYLKPWNQHAGMEVSHYEIIVHYISLLVVAIGRSANQTHD